MFAKTQTPHLDPTKLTKSNTLGLSDTSAERTEVSQPSPFLELPGNHGTAEGCGTGGSNYPRGHTLQQSDIAGQGPELISQNPH